MMHGFTLVELSIVLVIIGLIIGGVLVGQSLINSATINSQIRQLEQYDTAVSIFKQKYKQLPGDSSYNFYYSDTTSYIASSPDGNGFLNDRFGNSPAQELRGEPIMFFTHLSASETISEKYNVDGLWCYGKNEEYPEAAVGGTSILVQGNPLGEVFWIIGGNIADNCGNQHYIHNISNSLGIPAVTAAALDKKMDDGLPLVGDIVNIQRYWDADYTPYPMLTSGGTAYNVGNPDAVNRLLIKSKFEE